MSYEIIKIVLDANGYEELNPVQKEAVRRGLFEGKNLVVASPTASGKTLIAELAALHTALNRKKKTVYLVPLVALANEKYREFKERYSKLGIRVALSIGDYDSSDPWLREYDLIIASNEKMDSLLRHGIDWMCDIGLIVCDEIHTLDSAERGATLEMVLTKLRMLTRAQMIGLSATIKNVDEIASWIGAEVVRSEWRPVKLYEGVAYDNKIVFSDGKKYALRGEPIEISIAENTLSLNKQGIFFVSTRRIAESLSAKLRESVSRCLRGEEKEQLKRIAEEILNVLERPTEQCKKLYQCVRDGVAFHHAGLVAKQRALIEEWFRRGLIKFIVATPTLAAGINLPAFRVIVRDVKRYNPMTGSAYIPVIEWKQMCGRAGRPAYDEWGEGILVAKNEIEAEEFFERYIEGEPEEIYSRLGFEPVLRTHVLSLIASGTCREMEHLERFFSKTFYAFQYGDTSELLSRIDKILAELCEWGFVAMEGGEIKATRIGKRVSELYIDPLTAHTIITGLKDRKEVCEFALLHLLSRCAEMKPLLHVRQSEVYALEERVAEFEDSLLFRVPEQWDWEYENFLREMKTALLFEAWINEASEEEILENFNVTPGELRGRLEVADWLLYSMQELMLLLKQMEIIKYIRKLRLRVQHGVKEDLLPLVRLRGVGRVRARKLANAGIKSVAKLREVPLATLELLVGAKTAREIKKQVSR